MGIIKSHSDKQSLQKAGALTQAVLETLMAQAQEPGATTAVLEATAIQMLAAQRASAPFRAFNGFNHAICVSINDEIVNGPPSRVRTFQPGDLVSIATASELRGMNAKAAVSFLIGDAKTLATFKPAEESPSLSDRYRLLEATAQIVPAFIERASKSATLNEALLAIPETAAAFDVRVIPGLGGSGIGKRMHEPPTVPNQPEFMEETIPLTPGFCITLMPMMTLGTATDAVTQEDKWTFSTADQAFAAHFADTLFLTEDGFQPITDLSRFWLSQNAAHLKTASAARR